MQDKLANTPAFDRSLVEKYPAEYVIALPGVAITNIKARPPDRAINNEETRGDISVTSVEIAKPIGRSKATAPTFDITSVKNIVKIISPRIIK